MVYRSIHGPVIINDQVAFAIRYAGIDQLDMLTQYYRLNKAQNFEEWQAAMARTPQPGQSAFEGRRALCLIEPGTGQRKAASLAAFCHPLASDPQVPHPSEQQQKHA